MAPQLESPSDSSADDAEVSGWLPALCLLLTIVFPATSLYPIISHTVPTGIAVHTFNRMVLLGVYSLLFSALPVLSFMAGLRLWLVKPQAVGFARRFLLTYSIANAPILFSGSQLFGPRNRSHTLRWMRSHRRSHRRGSFGTHIWNTPSAGATRIGAMSQA